MSDFRDCLKTLRTGLWNRPIFRMRFIRCAFQRMVASVFCTARCFRIRSWLYGKRSTKKACSRFLDVSCSVADTALDRLVTVGRMLTIFGFLVRGANFIIVHLARLIVVVKKACLDVHDISLAIGSRIALERANEKHIFFQSRGRSLRAVAFAAGTLQWSRVFLGAQQSLTPAASSPGRRTSLQENHGQLCAWDREHMGQRALGNILCLLRSDWSLLWLDVSICTDASEKGCAFAVREECRELASEGCRVSERTRFKWSSKCIRARSRALRSITRCRFGMFKFGRERGVACPKGSRANFPGVLGMDTGGVRWFLPRGKHPLYFKHVPSCVPFDMLRVVFRRDAF